MTRLCKLALPTLFVLLSLTACSLSRSWDAWLVLQDVAAGEGTSALKRSSLPPAREPIRYTVEKRRRAGDLYRPTDAGAVAPLVLVPGAAPRGKDDPRLVAFANTLARARFLVLVPEIENLRELKVDPADAVAVADAVRHLAAMREAPQQASVGIAAISYAVGPAVLAALDPDAAAHVRYIVAVGGYYDIERVVTFFTTGFHRDLPGDPWRHREPNAYGKWVFARSNAERMDDLRDRTLIAAMAERKIAKLDAEVDDLAAELGEEGRAVYELLSNRDPERVAALISRLPSAIRESMTALDLARQNLSRLSARLILVHGRDDAIIPFTESRAIERTVPPGMAELYVADSLAHVDLGPTGLLDGITLLQAAYSLLSERDATAR